MLLKATNKQTNKVLELSRHSKLSKHIRFQNFHDTPNSYLATNNHVLLSFLAWIVWNIKSLITTVHKRFCTLDYVLCVGAFGNGSFNIKLFHCVTCKNYNTHAISFLTDQTDKNAQKNLAQLDRVLNSWELVLIPIWFTPNSEWI